jgi:hypothetical protein
MREAPSLAVIRGLQDAGANVRAYDPAGMALARTLLDNVAFAEDAYRCAEGAHALVLVTEWEAFRALDLGRIRDLLVTPILVDLRNCRLRSNRDIGMETWESRHPGYGKSAVAREDQKLTSNPASCGSPAFASAAAGRPMPVYEKPFR